MLKPFYNKKKNIDDRLVPAVTAADAGKVLGVTEDGKIAPVEGGGGSTYPEIKLKFTTTIASSVEVPAHSVLKVQDIHSGSVYALIATRESFILPANGEVNCTTDLIFLDLQPFAIADIKIRADFTELLSQQVQGITGALEVVSGIYFLYDKTEISVTLQTE